MLKKLKEIMEYRELFKNLTIKELKLKYKNSMIGFFWSFLNPLMMLVVYTFAFKYVMKITVPNFTVFVLSGLLPWTFFQGSIQGSTNSIVSNGALIKKVYFPREIVPLSQIMSNFVNFLITLLVLFLSLFIFKIKIGVSLIFLPIILLLMLSITIGISLALASLNVLYRDVSHFIEIIFMAWFYITPIVYPIDLIPKQYEKFILLNPMTLVIQSIREIIMNNSIPPYSYTIGLVLYSVIFIFIGQYIFGKIEKSFAEEI